MDAEKSSAQQTIEGRPAANWASIFLDYFDLKARLLAVESREASGRFIGLLLLLGVMLVLAVSSFLMYGAFLLYLVSIISSQLGLECLDLRRDSYTIQRWCFFRSGCGSVSRYFK
jgi:uncharacterized membrane protein YqjE